MNVKFSKAKEIGQEDIDLFTQFIGCSLPDDLRQFFINFNGAIPETNVFTISDDNQVSINKLIPITKIKDEHKYLDHVGSKVFPIAIAEGGNYVVIDLNENAAVYFWDHEIPQTRHKLASGIYEFIESLTPFDADDIELKEGQVKSAWIDPDFLKSLK